MLMRSHGVAQALDEFRRLVACVAEHARQPVLFEEISVGATRLGDPIGVKQNDVAGFKLHGRFFEGLRFHDPKRIARNRNQGANGAVR
jgi:hypothetical protein